MFVYKTLYDHLVIRHTDDSVDDSIYKKCEAALGWSNAGDILYKLISTTDSQSHAVKKPTMSGKEFADMWRWIVEQSASSGSAAPREITKDRILQGIRQWTDEKQRRATVQDV